MSVQCQFLLQQVQVVSRGDEAVLFAERVPGGHREVAQPLPPVGQEGARLCQRGGSITALYNENYHDFL